MESHGRQSGKDGFMEKYVVTENMMMQGDVCFVQGGVEASMLK